MSRRDYVKKINAFDGNVRKELIYKILMDALDYEDIDFNKNNSELISKIINNVYNQQNLWDILDQLLLSIIFDQESVSNINELKDKYKDTLSSH